MRLQYQLANGMWTDCGPRTEEFLARCVKHGRLPDEAAVLAALARGAQVRNDPADWYSYCHDGEVAYAQWAATLQREKERDAEQERLHGPVLTCQRCGQTGRSGSYPFSTLPGSGCCDDCM